MSGFLSTLRDLLRCGTRAKPTPGTETRPPAQPAPPAVVAARGPIDSEADSAPGERRRTWFTSADLPPWEGRETYDYPLCRAIGVKVNKRRDRLMGGRRRWAFGPRKPNPWIISIGRWNGVSTEGTHGPSGSDMERREPREQGDDE